MSPGARNWPFLIFTGLPRGGAGLDEIGLPAEEGRRLQHIDHRGHRSDLVLGMHVGQHRHADLLPDLGQDAQALVHAQAAEGLAGTAVGLVVGRLEDDRECPSRRRFPSSARRYRGTAAAIRPRRARRSGTAAGRGRLRNRRASWSGTLRASAALTKAMNSGWPVRGLLGEFGVELARRRTRDASSAGSSIISQQVLGRPARARHTRPACLRAWARSVLFTS